MRLVGRGHGAIRATHDKTLEFTIDGEITERATCVVAVGCAPLDARRVAGRIRITITAGSESFALEALGNPAWTPGGSAVVRRSDRRLPGTLATEATAAARDLPRSLLEALTDPAADVQVSVEAVPGPPSAVLVALDTQAPPDPRLAAELAAADVVVAEDEPAARLIGERPATGPVRVTSRVVVVATQDLPGATVATDLADVEVDVLGLPPLLAAAAASPSRAPLVAAGQGDARAMLRSAPATSRLAVTVPADEVPALLVLAAEIRGVDGAVLVAPDARPRRIGVGSPVPGRETVHLCFDAASESTALDPRVREAMDRLLADGVSTKSAANALAALTGWPRRRAYDTVLEWGAS